MLNPSKSRKLLEALESRGLTLGAAESLTGGLFASAICEIPGASKVFRGGNVSYNVGVKSDLLGVSQRMIDHFGVVSQPVANKMAIGGRKALKCDVCVSFTGNAGPDVEPGGAPVGRVHMAISTKKGLVELSQDFTGERNRIREKAVDMMLDVLMAIFC